MPDPLSELVPTIIPEPMNRKSLHLFPQLLATLLLVTMLSACATSPEGRRQLKLLPDEQIDAMGVESFARIKQQTPATQDPKIQAYVECIARQIIPQVRQQPDAAAWEVVVFDDSQANAFALPGYKIGVYTGLLEYARNQHQLAAVMGHEIAHVIAGHGNERVSEQLAAQAGMTAAAILLGEQQDSNTQLILAGLGLGVQYGIILPFSRAHESEADLIGLELMAKSGFKPEESVSLWQNMSQSGLSPPELLSTHPSGDTRIRQLRERMPKADKLYRQAQASGKRPDCRL